MELSFLHYVSLAFFASVLLMETSCCKRLFVLRLRKKLLINFDAVNGELTSSGIKLLLSIWFSGRYLQTCFSFNRAERRLSFVRYDIC